MKGIFKWGGIGCLGLIVLSAIFAALGITGSDDDAVVEETEAVVVDPRVAALEAERADSVAEARRMSRIAAIEDLKGFKSTEDEFSSTAFYSDNRTPKYTSVDFIYPYIGKSGENYFLRMKMQYSADDWLFIENAQFLVDGEVVGSISGSWERDNSGGQIWEYLDVLAKQKERALMILIANSEVAKVRYNGRQYHNDRTITAKEKAIMRRTLDVFKGLNGDLLGD